MAATKGSPWMGPSFTPMDQDPRGPWTRSPPRRFFPSFTRETGRGRPVFERQQVARGLNDVGKAVFGHQVRCVAPICANFYNYLFTERAFRAIISVYGPLF